MSSRDKQRTEGNLTLELKIISATDVDPHSTLTDNMDVYAVVSINGDNSQTQAAKTPIDYDGGSNPTWNHPVKFLVSETDQSMTVNVKLYNYWLEGAVDLEIGEVNLSVQELFASNPFGHGDKMKLMTCPVQVSRGTEAKLSLSYRFRLTQPNCLYPSLSDYSSSFRADSGRSSQPDVIPSQFHAPMTKLTLDLIIKMTKDVKDVSWIHGMDLYASVTIRDGTSIKHRSNTPMIFSVYKNPIWDHAMKFSLDEPQASEGRLTLVVQLITRRVLRGDKEMGQVQVPIHELLCFNPLSSSDMKLETRDVTGKSGKIGTLSFMYRFLTEQARFSAAPSQPTIPSAPTSQPFIIYIPAPQQLFGSLDPDHGASAYGTVHQGAHPGTSNGLHPVYMQPPYQSHGYQPFPPMQPK